MNNDTVVYTFLYILSIAQVLIGVIFGFMVWLIRANKKELDEKLSLKQDITLCDEIKKGFQADFGRGERKFDELIHTLREQTKTFSGLSESLAKVVVRLDYIERRHTTYPPLHRRDEDQTIIPGCD